MRLEDVPEPPVDWQEEFSDSDDESCDSDAASATSSAKAEKLAAWRSRKREELLEDMICDQEPDWNKPALLADPVATDLVWDFIAIYCMILSFSMYRGLS